MIPTMEPGNIEPCVCLLPTGSAAESVEGISHLLEHFLIFELIHRRSGAMVDGHTTEDYVILFCRHLTLENIIETLRSMEFDDAHLEMHKERLKKEIEVKLANREEFFFRFVWEGSDYEKSPLGLADRVDTISGAALDTLRRRLLKEAIFGYTRGGGVTILNSDTVAPVQSRPLPPVPIAWVKNKPFGERWYDICYFNRDIEVFYLLERMLKLLDPDKHIQLSEKKKMSALILEKGTRFPGEQVRAVKQNALEQLTVEVSQIKSNFEESALNELESMYFYGSPWSERCRRLFRTTDRRIAELVKKLTCPLI
ncbi:MAG: hypothetical protein NT166_02985 [Candidatus Aminicenantes bacterium]|nr:hypothetical protein [Candidatus Aminicenantes bacterium]